MIERVIDSSTLAKFLLRESGWERVKGILTGKPYTLDLAVKEVANAIWRRVTLMGDVSLEKAPVILGDLLELKRVALRVEPQDPYLGQALRIAIENRVTVYDSLFIAQALAKKAALTTSDERQGRVAERLNVKVEYI
ncbi:MAG: type II toxin-antitoxin system VapC family toxin [Acidilobaceae archaeon]